MRKKQIIPSRGLPVLKKLCVLVLKKFSSLTLGHMGIPKVRRFKIAGFSFHRPYDHSDLYTDIAGFLIFQALLLFHFAVENILFQNTISTCSLPLSSAYVLFTALFAFSWIPFCVAISLPWN